MKLKHLIAPILALGLCAGITSVQADTIPGRAPAAANVLADAPVKPANWTGFYIGGGLGYGALNAEINTPGFNLDGLSATGIVGNLQVGGDIQIPGSMLVLGARGGYEWQHVKFTVGPSSGAFSAQVDDGWYADGRVGLAMGTALPYVFAGYTKLGTSAGTPGHPVANMPELDGVRAGGGVEFRLPKVSTAPVTPTLAVEYTYIDFKNLSYGGGLVTINPTEQVGMLRLNLRFGQ
jgi:outer membrane immunogenic protein